MPVSFDSSRNFDAVDIIPNRSWNKRGGFLPLGILLVCFMLRSIGMVNGAMGADQQEMRKGDSRSMRAVGFKIGRKNPFLS